MAVYTVAVTDTHHPMIWNVREVVLYNELVLVCFLLAGDESLPGLDTVADNWTSGLQSLIVIIFQMHGCRWLVLLHQRYVLWPAFERLWDVDWFVVLIINRILKIDFLSRISVILILKGDRAAVVQIVDTRRFLWERLEFVLLECQNARILHSHLVIALCLVILQGSAAPRRQFETGLPLVRVEWLVLLLPVKRILL